MKVLILAGGSGTRFWPMSVSTLPKQFLALTSERTMLQESYLRFQEWLSPGNIFISTIEQYVDIIKHQLPELPAEQIIVEPLPRDTGPCIALAAAHFLDSKDDEVLVTMPADHYISDLIDLRHVLDAAATKAQQSACVVTLGVKPTRPETGYGYIDTRSEVTEDGILRVNHFLEKPSIEKAQQLIKYNHVYWNSGIFVWKPSTIAYYMKKYQSLMWSTLTDSDEEIVERYRKLPKLSIDYALLEKMDEIYCIPVDFEWDDLGHWSSMERILPIDSDGNLLQGNIQVLNTTNSTIFSNHKQTIVIGVDDLIIVSTENGLLICTKAEDQKVKGILQQLDEDAMVIKKNL